MKKQQSASSTAIYDLAYYEEHYPFALGRSKYRWCLNCERTYRVGEFRLSGGLMMCPYDDCGGDAVVDSWEWGNVRKAHPSYSAKPEKETVYPLYPEETA